MFIRKKKLAKYIKDLKDGNRAEIIGQKYPAVTPDQKIKNVYAQGYEEGTDNFYNAVCAKFKIKRSWD